MKKCVRFCLMVALSFCCVNLMAEEVVVVEEDNAGSCTMWSVICSPLIFPVRAKMAIAKIEKNNTQTSGVHFGMKGDYYKKFNGLAVNIYPLVTEASNGLLVSLYAIGTEGNNGIICSGLYALADDMNGISMSCLTNHAESSNGIQVAAVVNVAQDLNGIQIGGTNSITYAELNGIQCALGSSAKRLNGVQVGGLLSESIAHNGLQVGFINLSKTVNGVQIGGMSSRTTTLNGMQSSIVNLSTNTNGMQVGVANDTELLNGTQIGLLNRAASADCFSVQIGLLNDNGNFILPFINIVY